MSEWIEPYFSWPTLPFSVLLAGVCAYWLLVILTGMDIDLFDFDVDLDVDVEGHQSVFDWGLVCLKWFNLGDVPLMVWMSLFALAGWLTSAIFDKGVTDPTTQEIIVSVLRSAGIGIVAAKLLTQPLKGRLKLVEPNPAKGLIGRTCVITTLEATPEHGRADCEAEGAPLSLSVRTLDGAIPRGEPAEIVDYSPEQHVYYVRSVS